MIDLGLKGLKLIKPKVFRDERGFFLETFQQSEFEEMGLLDLFQQDNHSFSYQNCIRGMHFQSVPGQAKLIRTAVGRIYDVAVDIRKNSPTYGQWEGVILDDLDHCQLFIPVGFAHGFCVLSKEAHVLYKVTAPYDPKYERGFRWDDPDINVQWPVQNPILSDRDKQAPMLKEIRS
ncbi:MAG: dTDP-4-dehydrorhamnose 3,5-epimerase [Chlamydiales bacterium]